MRIASLMISLAVLPSQPALASDVTVRIANDSPAEAATKAQLERLLIANDVRRWLFTRDVVIDQAAIPHSHPVLTLHARYVRDDDLLLSTFLHEQLHWFLAQRQQATDAAIAELRPVFPALPVGFPDGAQDDASNYLHLLVCFLEFQADRAVMGELRARQAMEFWATSHYRRIYREVLDRPEPILAVLRKHDLLPPRLR